MYRVISIIAVVVLLLLPSLPMVPEYWITQLNYIGLASLVVLGLVLLTGVGGLTSFGQAAFVGIGAYTTAYLTTTFVISPWLSLVVGLIVTASLAYVLGAITLRLSGHFLPLGTIAWGLAIYYLFGNLQFLGQHDGIAGIKALNIFGFSFASGRNIYYLIWVFVFAAMLITHNLLDSRPGRAIRSLRGGSEMSEAFGVDRAKYKVIIFVYAAMLASISGWLYAHMQRAVSPSPFGLNYSIEYLFMAVVGGAGSVWGAVIGSSLILTLKDQLQNVVPKLINSQQNFELIFFGVLMILVLHHARDGVWPLIKSLGQYLKISNDETSISVPATADELSSRQQPGPEAIVLEVQDIRKEFGGLVAVNDISFKLKAGEIVGLIGPNGAGKSTSFNLISGVYPATSGQISFLDKKIDKLSAIEIAKLGIGRTFQHVQLLPSMTVVENVALGAHLRSNVNVVSAALRLDRKKESELLFNAAKQLQRVGLGDYLYHEAGSLALGQQRILEIARALAADPILLLLDEPAAGLRYKEKQDLAQVLSNLRDQGISILLVEHDMDFVMNLTDHIVVMDFGTKIAEGTPQYVQEHPDVLQAYLGGIE